MTGTREPSLALVEYLFQSQLPPHTKIQIERARIKNHLHYIYRLQYTSKASGRTMCVIAKGDTLPLKRDDLYMFYLRQIVLTPKEAAREFSRLYFLERRAKQDEFLFGSKNIRVAGNTDLDGEENGAVIEDKLNFEGYA